MFGFGKKKDGSGGSGGSNHPVDFDILLEKAEHHIQALQAAHKESWGLGSADRYEIDFEGGVIQFIFEGDKTVTAPVTLIGTWAGGKKEFLWGWDHPMCPPAENSAALAVKAYADTHDIELLQDRTLICEGDDGWGLAAIACLIGGLQGIYRAPNGENFVYLGFRNTTIRSIA